MIKYLENENEFESIISKGKVVVDFYADWCGPCRMLSPILEELESEDPSLTILKVNVDKFPVISDKFHIYSIPLLISYKDGEAIAQQLGYQSKDAVKNSLKI